MKYFLAMLLSLGLAGASSAQAPAKKGAPPDKAAKKEAPKIEGIEISRGERGFLGIQIVDATSSFKLTFYDRQKRPIEPDVARAALRWDAKYKIGGERVVLNPTGDGKSLSSPRNIRPPYNFKLFITLIKAPVEGQSPASETHVVDFRQ